MKRGMIAILVANLCTTMTIAAVLGLVGGLWAREAVAAKIKNVSAQQRYPWNGKVDIRYEMTGVISTHHLLVVRATDRENNASYVADDSALSGDTDPKSGRHHVVWDLDKQRMELQSTNVVFTVEYHELPLYCVVDLTDGASASLYPVTYMDEPPSGGFNTDEYKTTKLVLRKIPAGTYTMGSPSGESGRKSNEDQHRVQLTEPFYIGLFEVTQKQWELVMGSNPSYPYFSGDKQPVERVSWNDIRGNLDSDDWPDSSTVDVNSFIGRIQTRTGLEFDLPTEAQWEYACRAGTTTAYSYGGSANGDYMWYASNSPHDVGTKQANPWGLYDMHGNVEEWCLDCYSENLGTVATMDPVVWSSAYTIYYNRVKRGGDWGYAAADCRSASRISSTPSHSSIYLGFRLSWTLSR